MLHINREYCFVFVLFFDKCNLYVEIPLPCYFNKDQISFLD